MSTKIEWCEETWNPVTGCTKVSEGCRNCYAERMAKRLAGRAGYPADDPFAVTLHPDRLDQPLHWKKPRRVFVCSMGDLFHEDVPHDFIMDVMLTTAEYPEHTYIIVTKRAERASKYAFDPHVWRLVTIENQKAADERIPWLLKTEAAVRGVSVEPMLGPVDLGIWKERRCLKCGEVELRGTLAVDDEDQAHFPGGGGRYCGQTTGIDWVICGAETGPGKRHMCSGWAMDLRDDCLAAGVPFFFKKDSLGSRLLDGREWNEYPETPGTQDSKGGDGMEDGKQAKV